MALRRITKELKDIIYDPIPDCSVVPVNHNAFVWEIKIFGTNILNTPYEGGTIHLQLRFTQDYPFKPPQITIQTKLFHPMIGIKHPSVLCSHFKIIGGNWSPALTVSKCLAEFIKLLTDKTYPITCKRNKLATILWMDAPIEFDKIAQEWTKQYAMNHMDNNVIINDDVKDNDHDDVKMHIVLKGILWYEQYVSKNSPKLNEYRCSVINALEIAVSFQCGQQPSVQLIDEALLKASLYKSSINVNLNVADILSTVMRYNTILKNIDSIQFARFTITISNAINNIIEKLNQKVVSLLHDVTAIITQNSSVWCLHKQYETGLYILYDSYPSTYDLLQLNGSYILTFQNERSLSTYLEEFMFNRYETLRADYLQLIIKSFKNPTCNDQIAIKTDDDYTSSSDDDDTKCDNDPSKLYHSLTYISRGAYGDVYKGLTKNNRMVAIKKLRIPTNSKGKQDFFKSIHTEISLLKQCNSKYIIKLLNKFEDNDFFWMVLEFCSFGSIENFAGNCTQKQLKQIIIDVLSGLKYLHSQNIIHRDIKPNNILLHHSGIYKLGDLGIGNDEKLKAAQTKIGSLYYTAPEILGYDANINYDNKVDIWSFGVTIYFLATNSYPFDFQNKSLLQIAAVIASETPLKLKVFSIDIQDMINNHCLKRNPKQRLSTKRLLQMMGIDVNVS